MLKLVIPILISCLLISVDANKRVFTDEDTGCGDAVTRLVDAVINVTPKILKLVMQPQTTVITSPITNFFVAGEIAIVSEGSCRQELLKFTKLKSDDEIRCAFQYVNRLIGNLSSADGVILLAQANFYADIKYNFTDALSRETRRISLSETINVDLGDPEAAADEINRQSALETDGNIPFVISADAIENASGIISPSTLFFQGTFRTQFDMIQDEFFITPCQTVTTTFLNQVETQLYAESSILKARVLELPYGRGAYTCLFIIPDKSCGIKEVLTKIQDPDVFYKVLYSLKPTAVNVSLPFLNVSTIIDTEAVLTQLKVTHIFNEEENCIVNAVEGRNVSITASRIRPTAIVTSDGGIPATEPENPIPLKFNCPFIFIKLLQGIPMFAGYFGNPNNQINLNVDEM